MISPAFTLHPQLAKDSYFLGHFDLSQLLLINDCQFPWFVLVPQVPEIKEIYQLDESLQVKLWQESAQLSQVIMAVMHGDKLNVAAIGNMVPQLHVHHIVRYKEDACWPAPVWGKLPMVSYLPEVAVKIQLKIASQLTGFTAASI